MPRMLHIVISNALSRYATRLYPQEVREPFEGSRADLEIAIQRCKLCGNCARTCPTGSISVDKDRRLWERDLFTCIYCGDCVEACPVGALTFGIDPPKPASGPVRAAFTKPPEEDENSDRDKACEEKD